MIGSQLEEDFALTDNEVPQNIEGYRIVEPLGRAGSYGRVFIVQDEAGNEFALKLAHGADEVSIARFDNERWALDTLQHAAIPRLKATSDFEGRPYIVMSYAQGLTIEQIILDNQSKLTKESQNIVLNIARSILKALIFLEDFDIIHQDIKSDNVLVSAAGDSAFLIDFGLCHGEGMPWKFKFYLQPNAVEYSPPSKLLHPSSPKPKHDVFGLGVVLYELLTHRPPWEAQDGDDAATMARKMEAAPALPIRRFNPAVSSEVASFFESLLITKDADRPTASTALEALERLVLKLPELVQTRDADADRFTRNDRVIRDPLHGDIRYTEFERDIINTPEFQRLRRLRQLGTSHLVYPGAEHTRFLHALGTLHTAERILVRIEQRSKRPLDNHDRAVARAYALLHDISHAPFGHTLEDELSLLGRHDENRSRLKRILAPETKLGDLLRGCEPGRDVLELLLAPNQIGRFAWISELVSGPTGADVIDYIDRDALFCGLDHRVDSAIFRFFALAPLGTPGAGRDLGPHIGAELEGQHGFRLDGDFAALNLLRERHSLFLKVYSHKMKIAAGAMIGKALMAARTHNPEKFTEERVELLGDEEFLLHLSAHGGTSATRLVSMLQDHRFFVPVYAASVMHNHALDQEGYEQVKRRFESKTYTSPYGRAQLEADLAAQSGAKKDDLIFYVSPTPPGAQRVSHIVFGGNRHAAAEGRRRLKQEQVFADHLELWKYYLFVSPDLHPGARGDLADLATSNVSIPNELKGDQLVLNLI